MKLLMSPPSPFVRKVRVVIRETGQLDAIEEVAVTTSALDTDPGLMAANPLGKIPALIREDGPAIYDSRVITRYLDARVGAGLYPDARLWEILTLEATADGIMEAGVLMVYEGRLRPEAQQSPEWVEAQWGKLSRSLDAVNARWMSHLAGPLNMGQIAIGCALGYLDLRHDARGWREGRDALAAWFADFSQREAMIDTRPE
ncbi:MAG: glutathione S-transferase [Flavimaricola sp.]|nr:glutathione S-transferase [Flavimaricola sp.]